VRFGRVQGHGQRVTRGDQTMVSLAVMLDSGSTVTVVRDETLPWLSFGPEDDVVWQVDQLTQEAIGTTLADSGWEAISEDDTQRGSTDDGLSHSSVYVVRNLTSTVAWGGGET
jgi:hypothetical protein